MTRHVYLGFIACALVATIALMWIGSQSHAAPDGQAVNLQLDKDTLKLVERPVLFGNVKQITVWSGDPKPGNYGHTLRTGFIEIYENYTVFTIRASELTVDTPNSRKPVELFNIKSSDELISLVWPNDERWYSGLVLKQK